jgi:hypothetical protein
VSFIGQGSVKRGVSLIAEERLILYSTIRTVRRVASVAVRGV